MAKQNIVLLASAAQTASANGAAIPVGTLTMAMACVNITAKGGTSPTLKVWLQGSDDEGTTWYDLPYDYQMDTTAGGTDVTAVAGKRNICESSDALGQWAAIFKHLPCKHVRAVWAIGGTGGPTFTFAVKLAGA